MSMEGRPALARQSSF